MSGFEEDFCDDEYDPDAKHPDEIISKHMNKMKQYITISEFGDIHTFEGKIPPEVIDAADQGLYEILDITRPKLPMIYMEEGWTDIDELPKP